MANKSHTHKYQKAKLGKDRSYIVYKCVLPECSHYITPELLPGKLAICFRCESKFVIERDMVRKGREMLKLHCKNCTRNKTNETKVAAASKAESLMQSLGIAPVDE